MSHMKRTVLLATFISLSFITVLAQQQPADPQQLAGRIESGTWVTVAPVNAGFSILMPAKPSEDVQSLEGHPGMENHLITFETKLAGYVVSHLQFSGEVTDPALIKVMLDRGREGGIASTGGKLKSEKEIKLNNYFGREWLMELPGGLSATARAYWVKRRLYQTVFVITPNANDSPEVIKLRDEARTRFLDSFSLSGDVNN